MDFSMTFSTLASKLVQSPIRQVTQAARDRKSAGYDVIALAGGLPDESLIGIKSMSINGIEIDGVLEEGMQYHPGWGTSAILSRLKSLQQKLHPGTYDVGCSCGNTDALLKSIEILTEPGDAVFVEEFTWTGVLAQLIPRGRLVVTIQMDERGLVPAALEEALSEAARQRRVLYTVPTGQNPTGISVDEDRKKEIYEVCRRRNCAIIEDDPYYFLDFAVGDEKRNKSYLEMDADGRVVRLDSASKIMAPGMRLGWVSAPPAFLQKFKTYSELSTQFPSGLAQAAFLALDFEAQVKKVVADYTRRRDVMQAALLDQGLDKDVAEWQLPSSGMFFWIKQNVVSDTKLLLQDFVDAGVAVVPGYCFSPSGEPSPCIRLTFAYGTDKDIQNGVERIATVLRSKKIATHSLNQEASS